MSRRPLGEPGGRRSQTRRPGRRRPAIAVEELERKALLAAIPTATLNVPAQSLIGESLSFTVGFTNTSPADAGYGPYLDLILPATGADGAGTAADDGVTFTGATYLGAAVTSTVRTFDAAGRATHPYARDAAGNLLVATGTPGDQLVVLQLPFGSFTPGQPTATVQVAASLSGLADAGTALAIQARGGFRYGNDALDNPTADPSVVGATAGAAVSPTLMTLMTTYLGPEDETATGPNFPRQYLVTADVANGQTLTDLDLTDVLPGNLQFVGVDATTIRGTATATTAVGTPAAGVPGGTLTRRFARVTGTTAANDATLLFTFYVPRVDAGGAAVLAPATGAPATSANDARARGDWAPTDARDAATVAASDATPVDHALADRSLATQQSVRVAIDTGAAGPSPGDTLEYTIQAQVSDYFAFRDLVLANVLSDGQRFDPGFTPTLLANGNPFVLATAGFGPANLTVSQNFTGAVAGLPYETIDPATDDGTSTVTFRVSDELVARGQDGRLLGGLVPPGGGAIVAAPGDGPTTFTVVFRAVVQERFTDHYPSGEPNLNHNDRLDSSVLVRGEVLRSADLAPTGNLVTDASGAGVAIVAGDLTLGLYAVNGSTTLASPVKIAAGDAVTYRMRYTLPISDEEQLALTNYLPLPIFDALGVTAFDDVGAAGGPAAIPAAGRANFGPADTFRAKSGLVPTLAADGTSNSLRFAYPDFKDPANAASTIDLLFTVRASDRPFADGLFLASQARAVEGSTNAGAVVQDKLAQLQLTEPALKIKKGVVATDNAAGTFSLAAVGPVAFSAPGSAGYRGAAAITSAGLASRPIDSNLTRMDAGDLVTFAVVVENTGTGLRGAFDVRLRDTLPAGFSVPAGGLNLRVTDGAGTDLAYTNLGAGLFDPAGGIELDDPGTGVGSLAAYAATGGRNLAVLTYDLQADGAVTPGQVLTNTATLTRYATSEGGPDFTATDPTDAATATVAAPRVAKAITATDQESTAGASLAIGEVATYTVTITVPEGVTPAARLVDTLPTGLAIVGLDAITASPALGTSVPGGFAAVLAGATVGAGGSSATFNLGTLTNPDRDNAAAETITVVYRVVALNVATNANGTARVNSARLSYTGGSATATATATVATPLLQVDKSASVATADAGDSILYTIVLSHAAASGADAFDVALADALPAGLAYVPGSLAHVAGQAPTSLGESGGTIAATFDGLAPSATSTITFRAVVDGGVGAFQTLTNTARVTYTTLPGPAVTPRSPYSPVSTERTGSPADPGGAANTLGASGSAAVGVAAPGLSKEVAGTSEPSSAGRTVVVGERVRYRVTVAVPEGTTTAARLVDTLPDGLAIVSLDAITASPALATSVPGGFAAVLAGAVVGAGGASATWDFGTLTNADRDNATADAIVLDYTAVVLNVAGNQSGAGLVNAATFATAGGSSAAAAPALTVAEPVLVLTKTPAAVAGDAGGEAIGFTIVVAHGSASAADAFDVAVVDALPAGFTFVPGSLEHVAGATPAALSESGGTITARFGALPLGATSTFAFRATLDGAATPGGAVTNTARLAYTSLPGDATEPASPYHPASTERTGSPADPGGALNDQVATASGTVAVRANAIAGSAYIDANNDGTRQAGEAGLAGVTITLEGADNLGTAVLRTAVTDAAGAYRFDGLRPGTYTLSEAQPAGYLDGREAVGTPFGGTAGVDAVAGVAIPLGANAEGLGYTFGELRPASVAGAVYRDDDNDGVRAAGEPGLAGVAITLTGTDDRDAAVSITTTTGADGSFRFDALRPGTYTLAESQPAGYLDGEDAAGDTGGTPTDDRVAGFVLGENTSSAGVTFGELAPASLAGSAYIDANNDGIRQEGERGLAGVAITLAGTDDRGAAVSLTLATGPDGSYHFDDLRPGTYAVAEVQPEGYLDGKDARGTAGGTVADDRFEAIDMPPGATGTGYLFGELTPASLAGVVFRDDDNDGIRQAGERGLAGVTITLTGVDDRGDSVVLTSFTSEDGTYLFAGLRPGDYAIAEAQPVGYLDGGDAVGSLGGASGDDLTSRIVAAAGDVGVGYAFGELRPASVAGAVFRDDDNDGVRAAGEPGLAGVAITLTGSDDRGAAVSITATTGADGSYRFGDLRPGTYALDEAQPAGYLDGRDAAGTEGGSLADDRIAGIGLTPGATGAGYDFGELTPAQLAGAVYLDADNDGVRDAGERGLAGVAITLTGTDDRGAAVVLVATSGADGAYRFGDLRPGTYAVAEAQPEGYLDGRDAVGTLGGTPGDDRVGAILVRSGVAGAGYDFGELAPGRLEGLVYRDDSNDGVRGEGEPGLAGVTITLSGTDDLGHAVALSTATTADGAFAFGGLRPGVYGLVESQPAGYLDGRDAAGDAGGDLADDRLTGIALRPGGVGGGITFGELAPAGLAGSVYRDRDADGLQGPSDPGIAGVTITLSGTDDLGQVVLHAALTDEAGRFGFEALRPGSYTLVETQPAGYLDGAESIGTQGGSLAGDDTIAAIVLAPGGVGADNRFGELVPSSLGGAAFADANNDGVRQADEAGIAGVAVTLVGTDDRGAAVSLATTTDADGAYGFAGLRPGSYSLREVQPSGYLDGGDRLGTTGGLLADDAVAAIALGEGAAGVGYTFGELAPAALAGAAYRDDDNDGVRDAGEPGIGGVAMTLTGSDDRGAAVSLATVTTADGGYAFTGLRPGRYAVSESQPAGFLDGADRPGTAGGSPGADRVDAIPLLAGVAATGYNFGELAPASLAGSVYLDANNDGIRQEGEPGIAGVTVTLSGLDDLGQPVALGATTREDGTFAFAGLRPSGPGGYALSESQPAGYLDGADAAGTPGGLATGDDRLAEIVLAPGGDGRGHAFGELAPASLAGGAFRDDSNDGVRQEGEPGLAGVTITLTGTDDRDAAVARTATTAADGSYRFDGLRPGVYNVAQDQPAGYLDGRDAVGSLGGVAGDDRTAAIPVPAGAAGAGYDFGELLPASLAGSAFVDRDGDGVRDAGEPGIGGVTITLVGVDDRDRPSRLTTETAADGAYRFGGLRPGLYEVSESQPAAYRDGRDAAGSAGGEAGDDVVRRVGLGAGVAAGGYTFGERGASLAGTIYLDGRNHGERDPGEGGQGGVEVRLFDEAGRLVATTRTATDGSYRFDDLPAGRYRVVETVPDRFGHTTPVALDVDLTLGGRAGLDFGLSAGSLAGTVYRDANANGVRDAGEPGIAGVTIALRGVDAAGRAVGRTAVTAADGSYRFDALLGGTYTVAEAQPAGYLDGDESVGTRGGVAGDDRVAGIPLALGSTGAGYDFGELAPASLAGSVYLDLHRNGVRDAGDVGIAGVAVSLAGTDDRGDAVDRVLRTAADGSYRFDGLRPGRYEIREAQPRAFGDGRDAAGTQGGVAGDDRITIPALGAGVRGASNDFGEVPRPGCKLDVLVPFGTNSVEYLRWRRSLDPARFDRYHPALGRQLAGGANPQVTSRVPRGPLIRRFLPTLGSTPGTRTVPAPRPGGPAAGLPS
jgi:fimbrial isopeptide formation D2 family protein/uncharacterized repeat protein (TIGR01451 family)